MMLGDTIAAISTPRGRGGVALLRVSGPDALDVCERVFFPKNKKTLRQIPPRTSVYGSIYRKAPTGTLESIDDGLAVFFPSPASFTGEDTVEITCHGGALLTETVLTALIAAGARPADAGEFTRRAFVNGKMGLSSAEALGKLLEAQTDAQLRLAHKGTHGGIEAASKKIYDRLCSLLASVYVKIDYPDEDLAELTTEEMLKEIDKSLSSLQKLADSYRTGHAVMEGIPTVICGSPNVGKSSLYNRLVGHDAAIVTEVAGTTRDVLSQSASLGSVTLRLFDTAGLHETTDPVERIGIERAHRAMEGAELILAVFDGTRAPTDEERTWIKELQSTHATVIALINKSDLPSKEQTYRSLLPDALYLSAKENEGLDELKDLIEKTFLSDTPCDTEDPILTGARQHGAVLRAMELLKTAKEGISRGLSPDLYCTDLESAMQSLSELDGRAVCEDIISEIFSHFCVGK